MKTSPNLALADMGAVLSHQSRVALPFYRDERRVCYVQFSPKGPELAEMAPIPFDGIYHRKYAEPVLSVASKFLKASLDAYLPDVRAKKTLAEIIIMASTNNTDAASLTVAQLTAAYNEVAAALGKPTVKSFKDKPTATKRLEAIKAEATALSKSQQEHADKADQPPPADGGDDDAPKAGKRKAAAAKKAPAAKTSRAAQRDAHNEAKKASAAKKAPAKKASADAKPRGMGIGAFCCDLLVKGKSNDEVLAAVQAKFPDAKTSSASIAWYRNDLRNKGKLPAAA